MADDLRYRIYGAIVIGVSAGGFAIVQDPETAEVPIMPREAMKITEADLILSLDQIALYLNQLNRSHDKGN